MVLSTPSMFRAVCIGLVAFVAGNASASMTFETFKQSAVYKEALAKGFAPTSVNKGTANGGPFSRGTRDDPSLETEEKTRFEQALKHIEELKALHPHATFSINTPFALMTQSEFLSYVDRSNINPDAYPVRSASASASTSTGSATSTNAGPKTGSAVAGEVVDWEQKGCVSAVKDQGQCGACWAFSSTAAMESGYCVATGSLPTLSEQQLISCDNTGQNTGCGGGYAPYAMDWIAKSRSGKMCTMSTYPFTSTSGSVASCRSGCSEVYVGVTGYDSVRQDPGAMEDQVRKHPISMFVYSGSSAFQFYSGGILTGSSCDKSGAHSVLAVGFGEANGVKYWRLKNQWGTNWGERGYVRIQRRYTGDAEGACGVELYGSWPTFSTSLQPPATTAAPTTATPTTATVTTATPTTETPTTAPATPQVVTSAPTTTEQASTAPPQETPTSGPTISVSVDPTSGSVDAIVQSDSENKCGRLDEGVDYLGNDFHNASAASVGECCTMCQNTNGCNAFSFTKWKGGHCWLKTRAGVVVPNPSAVSSSLYDISNATHKHVPRERGYKYPGDDLDVIKGKTADECMALCEDQASCNAYSWAAKDSGTCSLKSVRPAAPEFVGVDEYESGIVYKCSNLQLKTDFKGQDIAVKRSRSPEACCAICQQTDGCKAFAWSDFKTGTCWLKSGADHPIELGGVVAATL